MLQPQKGIIAVLVLVIVGAAYFTASQLSFIAASYTSFDRPLPLEVTTPRVAAQENFGFPVSGGSASPSAGESKPPSPTPSAEPGQGQGPLPIVGKRTYRSEKYGFEVSYPTELPFYEANKEFSPSVFTLLGSIDNVNVSAFMQVIPQENINLYPFSSAFESPPVDLVTLASALRSRNNTEMKSVGLNIAVTVSDIQGSGGLKGIKSYVESASRPDGTKITGIAYYFYRAPYFYRLVSIIPGIDAQLSLIASTFKFIPIVNTTSSTP